MITHPTCNTCTHWTSLIEQGRRPLTTDGHYWGECVAASAAGGSERMMVWDSSDRDLGGLTTRDDFGCVEHTPVESS